MFPLRRVSFRQLLLVAFLLIAGLLAAASLNSLFTLERLMTQSRAATDRAVRLTAAVQHLAERSVTMERAARQYMVLEDKALLQRYQEAADDGARTLAEVLGMQLEPALVGRWIAQVQDIGRQLSGSRDLVRGRERSITAQFSELNLTNALIAEAVRKDSDAENRQLQAEIEAGRLRMGREALGAIGVAVMLALGFGYWLTEPLKRLERAIVGLGMNRLGETVDIRGPSDLHALGQRLEWLRVRLKEVDEDKTRFLRHVSHQLKTPLAALREGVALLEDGVVGELTPDQREIARILGHNTAALQAQIEDLLRFNTAAAEAGRLSRRRIDLKTLVQTQVDAQKLQWQARQLRVELVGDPIELEVDPEKLGTALGNLLSNAIRFSPPGGRIVVSLSQQPGHVSMQVSDDGPGVAESDRTRVFDLLYRGERQPEGALRGTGIGLSIVRHYVEAHGGRVELLAEGPGARFRIELPNAAV